MIMMLKLFSFAIWLLIMLVMIIGGHKYALTGSYRSKIVPARYQVKKNIK